MTKTHPVYKLIPLHKPYLLLASAPRHHNQEKISAAAWAAQNILYRPKYIIPFQRADIPMTKQEKACSCHKNSNPDADCDSFDAVSQLPDILQINSFTDHSSVTIFCCQILIIKDLILVIFHTAGQSMFWVPLFTVTVKKPSVRRSSSHGRSTFKLLS